MTGSRRYRKEVIRTVVRLLNEIHHRYGVQVHHLQLMSNHYHLILTTPDSNLDRAMQYFNSRVAPALNRLQDRQGHLWGERYRSTILDRDRGLARCVRYVYRNPVRARMVAHVCRRSDSTYEVHASGRRLELLVVEDVIYVSQGNSQERRQWFVALVGGRMTESEEEETRKGLRRL